MQSSTSLSSISSAASSNSSTYGSRTILEAKDLPFAAPRCRSSIVGFLEDDQTLFSSQSPPPPPLPPPRRQSQIPSTTTKSMAKCRHLFRTCLSSTSSPLALPNQAKLSNSTVRKQYFAKLCHDHRLLLALSDYECPCGCHFSMRQGSFVILYETRNEFTTSKKSGLVTVISNELVCSKIPSEYVCDVELLRERVRSRRLSDDDEQSFDM
jgi:hypothetical protein